jgi:hypothetical protein
MAQRKTTKGSETGSHVSPVSVKVTRTFNIFESISESISDSNDYLIRTEGNNDDQSSVLFEQRKSLTQSEKKTIKEWLLVEE